MEFEMTDELKRTLRTEFAKRDKIGNGRIKKKYLSECMKVVGFYSATVEDENLLYKAFDADGDGFLSIDEIIENVDVIIAHSTHKDSLVKCFEKFDKDGKGFIREDQLRKILCETGDSPMTEEDADVLVKQLIIDFDSNKDRKFSYAEFVRMVMQTDILDDGEF